MTSRIESLPSSTIARRSMPMPMPPVRRHPVRHRLDVVGVAGLGLRVAGLALVHLHLEALRLLLAVVQLAERVRELHPADDVLEALDDRLVVVGGARERRQLDRPVVDDRRLDQLGLDEVRVRVVDELRPRAVARDVDVRGGELRPQLGLVARPDAVLSERVDELQRAATASRARARARGRSTFVPPIVACATRSTSVSHRSIVSR